MEYRSRAVRSLVELHEREMRAFLETWKRFAAAGAPMPEAHGDESYESRERLAGHVLMAARGYLVRIGEWVSRPVTDVDTSQDPLEVVRRAQDFADHVLGAYRRHLSQVTTEELEPQSHKTRWGDLMSVEMLLEHAVVHPMRHRIQLERILAGGRAGA
ncbi:MAG TPA: DinB family protein [Candidatus Eisenbacteria bacterium]|nr:DinB family protein [Candidatus Eisenbacteria bacterium]